MRVVPLAAHSPRAVEDALRSHGWDAGRARDAAGGLHPAAFLVSGLEPATVEAVVIHSGRIGLGVVSGDDWAVLAGSQARLSALARPWVVPEPLRELAVAIGLALPPTPPTEWVTARGAVALDRPVLAGILNVTPDSFSDGGRHGSVDAALLHAEVLLDAGADLIDVGGESTRPGRTAAVDAEVELGRVVPVIDALSRRHPALLISVDTVKAGVARAALDAGAAIVNDVSALRLDPAMATTVATAGAGLVLMHSRGGVLELASYAHAEYPEGVVAAVIAELRQAMTAATDAGVHPDRIVLDPGFGFSKTVPQNMLLLDQLGALQALGRPLLVGPSRKRFLGGESAPADRDGVSATACALAWERGARLFRVHDAAAARASLRLAHAIDHS